MSHKLKKLMKNKKRQDKDNLSDWSEDSIEVESKNKNLTNFFDDLIKAPAIDLKGAARTQLHKNKIKEDVRQHNASQGLRTTLEQKIKKVTAIKQRKAENATEKKAQEITKAEDEDDEDLFASDEEGGAEGKTPAEPKLEMEEIKDDEEEEEEKDEAGGVKVKRGVPFSDLGLIKPLLKACSEKGYAHATPIQKLAIPPVLQGRDVLASAVTGSGKTAAFLLPILQNYFNLSASGKVNLNTTRALVIIPTRELAMQCYEVFQSLNKYVRMTCALVIGSSSMDRQKVELSRNPYLIIATPGRIIDHLQNSKNFDMDDVDTLVLDEADKLLDLGFMYELEEIIKAINPQHQTLLFSATLTGKINELIKLALKKPIRVSANPDFSIARKLRQEYIKIEGRDRTLREAVLLKLTEEFQKRVIIFFKTKMTCHKIAVLFGLVGLQAKEMHGDLSQSDRIEALEQFKENKVQYLLSTDLAARGIDIKQVATVINFELPSELTKYIHRVGRTARAGESGTSITICDDFECKKLKTMIKQSKDHVYKRELTWSDVEQYKDKIEQLGNDIRKVFKMESYEKDLAKAEQAAARAENMLKFQDEIMNRPRKTWMVTPKQKKDLIDQQRKVHGHNDDDGDDDQGQEIHTKKSMDKYQDLEHKIMGKKNNNNKNHKKKFRK